MHVWASIGLFKRGTRYTGDHLRLMHALMGHWAQTADAPARFIMRSYDSYMLHRGYSAINHAPIGLVQLT